MDLVGLCFLGSTARSETTVTEGTQRFTQRLFPRIEAVIDQRPVVHDALPRVSVARICKNCLTSSVSRKE